MVNNIGYPITRMKLNIGLTKEKGSTIIEVFNSAQLGTSKELESF